MPKTSQSLSFPSIYFTKTLLLIIIPCQLSFPISMRYRTVPYLKTLPGYVNTLPAYLNTLPPYSYYYLTELYPILKHCGPILIHCRLILKHRPTVPFFNTLPNYTLSENFADLEPIRIESRMWRTLLGFGAG